MNKSFGTILVLGLLLLNSCKSESNETGKKPSTPTTGTVKIAVDETLRPIFEAEIKVFESDYPRADIQEVYMPEGDAINMLLNDSVQLAIVCRQLTQKEKDYIKNRDYQAVEIESARDGVALILSPENNDTTIMYNKLEAILKGEITNWSELNKNSNLGKIQLVFDNAMSSTYRFIQDATKIKELSPKNIYAVGDNEKVIDYVSKNKGAIGFIGSNWISDSHDTTTVGFIDKINVMGIAPTPEMKGAGEFYQPYQAYIAQRFYPFTRNIYTVCTEPRAGLATGFTAFLAGDKGQRIYLKSGLVPAKMPLRLIKISK